MSTTDIATYRRLLTDYYAVIDAVPRDYDQQQSLAAGMIRLVKDNGDEALVRAIQAPFYQERISR